MNAVLTAQAVQSGKGKGRDPFLICRHLASLNPPKRPTDIARELGVSDQAVSQVIRGVSNSKRILEALEAKGCPPEYLYGAAQQGGQAA